MDGFIRKIFYLKKYLLKNFYLKIFTKKYLVSYLKRRGCLVAAHEVGEELGLLEKVLEPLARG